MQLTFKIVLDKRHLKKDQTYPLKLRVFQDRVFKECSLKINVQEKDWDISSQSILPSNAKNIAFNSKLAITKGKVQSLIFLGEDLETALTPESIIEKIKGKRQKRKLATKLDIFEYAQLHIEELKKAGRIGSAHTYTFGIKKLQAFSKKDKLTFESIDFKFISSFNTSLLHSGVKINSVGNYLRSIRALFNKAIKEELLDAKFYPFRAFKIKTERTISRALTKLEIGKMLTVDLPIGSSLWHHRNLFALSFCFVGINFFYLLTLTKGNFVDDRIIFRRRKTHKIYSIKLQPKVEEIFGYYFTSLPKCEKEFVLPFVKNKNNATTLKSDVLQAIKTTNKYLKQLSAICNINKNVGTYYARCLVSPRC